MIDPRIALQVDAPGIADAINRGIAGARQIQSMRLENEQAPLRNELLQNNVDAARNQQRQASVAQAALEFQPIIQRATASGNTAEAKQYLMSRVQDLTRRQLSGEDVDATETLEALRLLETEGPQTLFNKTNDVINVAQRIGVLKAPGGRTGLASAKTEILPDGSVVQALPSGDVQVRNPGGDIVTGQDRADTLRQSQQFAIEEQRQEAGVAVERARGIARAGAREQRASTIKTELATRNRNAARESVRLNQALKVASEATQGTLGATKLKMAKLFPDIDVTNEALLDQSLTQLALDQLQNFKGPTTDFEFGVTQNISGQLGDAKTANIAKLNSLHRANWFNKREFDQFNRHVRSGGDPDTFAFNFGEPMKTKKGVFTLQDIQDTAVANNLSIEDTMKRLNE